MAPTTSPPSCCRRFWKSGSPLRRAASPIGSARRWSDDYIDLATAPKALADWTPMLASNTAHLARLLKESGYPGKAELT
jgi:hypothetical protein